MWRSSTGRRIKLPLDGATSVGYAWPMRTKRVRVVKPVSVHLRLPRALHAAWIAKARTDHRTLNSAIVVLLSRALTESKP